MRKRKNGASFWTSRILVVCACALLVYSFVSLDGNGGGAIKTNEEEVYDDGDEKENSTSPRLVFMVIDAFRLSFLTSPESPMTFTKSQISAEKSAKLFDAYARMPTVTLPRITAYITGTLPSFGTILTNLATDEIKIDNWVARIQNSGKSVHFFGDDTWIRLLPGKFEKSEGVTSFFVNDFTEVDQNVTRHLSSEFLNQWDVLILHYLGLDHIGHSLGGNSPKISEKLVEMDEIIAKIHGFLDSDENKKRENYLIVCGDHGMTPGGSHGGASPDETRVPVVIWKIGGNPKKIEKNQENPPKIEQIDVSATIFDIFGLKIPPESYGISLVNHFRGETQEVKYLETQHRHFKNIVKEKQLSISDICEENCDYSNKFVQSALKKWFRKVQEELIGTASEIPNASIGICVFLLIGATIISSRQWIFQCSKLNLSIFLVNIISFASSLIEEEHEIWYYLGTTVIVIRLIQWLKNRKRKELKTLFLLAFLHRTAFGYMQSTRRRWSMDPSLLPISQFSEKFDWKVDDLNTALKCDPIMVVLISFAFWISFIDGPWYFIFFPTVSHLSRIFEFTLFDAYFLHFIRFSVIPISYSIGSIFYGLLPLILSIVPISQILLFLFIYRIGQLSSELQLGHAENVIFCMSSFFYLGNSNSLSTLSLTSAYVGLLDYYPALVGLQLILYTFAGPIVFLCGRNSSTSLSPSPTSWLQLHFTYRISSLATSLACLYIFQNHLFVWSVYSPKVVYDMVHAIFFGVLGLL